MRRRCERPEVGHARACARSQAPGPNGRARPPETIDRSPSWSGRAGDTVTVSQGGSTIIEGRRGGEGEASTCRHQHVARRRTGGVSARRPQAPGRQTTRHDPFEGNVAREERGGGPRTNDLTSPARDGPRRDDDHGGRAGDGGSTRVCVVIPINLASSDRIRAGHHLPRE